MIQFQTMEQYSLLKENGKTYMCDYLGMDENQFGDYIAQFLINGEVHTVYLREDDLRDLADDSDNKTADECADFVDNEIRNDTLEYIIGWEVYDQLDQ